MSNRIQRDVPVPSSKNPRSKAGELSKRLAEDEDFQDRPKKQPKRYKQVPLNDADVFWRKGW